LGGGGGVVEGGLGGGGGVDGVDALRHVAVGDALNLEHVQTAQLGNLLESKGGVLDQPHGGGFRHQEFAVAHRGPFRDRHRALPEEAKTCTKLRWIRGLYPGPAWRRNWRAV